MIAFVGALVAVCAVILAVGAARGFSGVAEAVRRQFELYGRERTLHNEQVCRIIDDFAEERREWTAERTVLLNRIQDPGAGVAMSMATLPPTVDLDVDLTR